MFLRGGPVHRVPTAGRVLKESDGLDGGVNTDKSPAGCVATPGHTKQVIALWSIKVGHQPAGGAFQDLFEFHAFGPRDMSE